MQGFFQDTELRIIDRSIDACGCVQGVAPFGEDIALLTYVLEESSSPRSASSTAIKGGAAVEARRPEVGDTSTDAHLSVPP